jgi:hypothetical protein
VESSVCILIVLQAFDPVHGYAPAILRLKGGNMLNFLAQKRLPIDYLMSAFDVVWQEG